MTYDTKENWDKMAEAYDCFTQGRNTYSAAIEWPCVEGLLPRLEGKTALDLGCGAGRFTFLLEKMGADKPIGVDLSQAMLTLAKQKAGESGSSAQFVSGDAGQIRELFPPESFDFVFSSTLTHFLPNITDLFQQTYDVLRKGGSALFSVIHPVCSARYPLKQGTCFPREEDWSVRYLDGKKRAYVQPWIEHESRMENFLSESYHYTFSDYVNAILSAGFSLNQVVEPRPPEQWKTEHPVRYDTYLKTPTYLILRIQK